MEDPPSPDAVTGDTLSKDSVEMTLIAESPHQWTGVAVGPQSRMFVNFPHWSDSVPVSVAALKQGEVIPWPNAQWNNWQGDPNARRQFICVQSVVADRSGTLWVLDPASPGLKGVVEGGARMHRFDIATGALIRSYFFPDSIAPRASYLNDLRVDTTEGYAYITDSGLGAIVVVNLRTGRMRRLLDEHPSTQATRDHLMVEGVRWEGEVHSDGIALSPDRKHLYYHALSGDDLYRVLTAALQDTALSEQMLAQQVQREAETVATDGMRFDKEGNLYFGGLEENAIYRYSAFGDLDKLTEDEAIKWADTFARDPQDRLYFTTSQIHLPPDKRTTYKLFRLVYPAPAEEDGGA